MQPQPWEVPGIYGGVGRSLGQFGSGFVGPAAGMLGQNSGAWMKGYAQGQEARSKLQHEQMTLWAEETAARQQQEFEDYRDAFAAYGGDPTTGLGADESKTLKGVGQLRDALYAVARQYNDKYMLATLESGDIKGAENVLKWRDAQHSNLKAAIKAQEKDTAKHEEEAPFRGTEEDPSRATDPSGAPTRVDPPNLPDASVPRDTPDQQGLPAPEPASPPAPKAATPTAPPAEDNTDQGTGLDPFSTTPDDSHRAQADERQPTAAQRQPQGIPTAAQPQGTPTTPQRQPQGIQVAEAGASDAPPVWVGQTLDQPPATLPATPPVDPAWGRSRAIEAARANVDSGGNYFLRGPIDAAARKAVNDPMFRPTSKGYPGYPPAMTPYITTRAKEISDHLDWIANDPHLWGRNAYNAIREADPEMATALMGYVRGDQPLPSSARYSGLRDRLIGLGHKMDWSFNQSNYANRVQLKAALTHGQDGRTIVSMATGWDHLEFLKRAAMDLKQAQVSSPAFKDMPIANWLVQKWYEQAPSWTGVLPGRTAIEKFKYGVRLIAPEVARAQKGAAPTNMEVNDAAASLDPSQSVEVLMSNIQVAEDRMRERYKNIATKFKSLSGGHGDPDMLRMFKNFEAQGLGFDPPPPGTVDPGPVPMTGGGSYSDGMRNFLQSHPEPAGETIHDSSDYFK
jgi:hypothetical protein